MHMDTETIFSSNRPRAGNVIDEFASVGHYHFTTEEMRFALGTSQAATRLALARLAKKGLIASPARGFYVIVPPAYRRVGCLPPEEFISKLMECRGRPYYVALLSAAEYHGAAHQSPQVFQVAVEGNHRPISCGLVRVRFISRARIAEIPVQTRNTRYGSLILSTPEATAFDLVGYALCAGGWDNVATVLCELAEEIDPDLLCEAAQTAPVTWAQRLGYLLELVEASDKTLPLKNHVRRFARNLTPLVSYASLDNARREDDWKLLVNADVESEV